MRSGLVVALLFATGCRLSHASDPDEVERARPIEVRSHWDAGRVTFDWTWDATVPIDDFNVIVAHDDHPEDQAELEASTHQIVVDASTARIVYLSVQGCVKGVLLEGSTCSEWTTAAAVRP